MMAFSDGSGHREKKDHKDVREVFERNGMASEGENGSNVERVDPASSSLLLKGASFYQRVLRRRTTKDQIDTRFYS